MKDSTREKPSQKFYFIYLFISTSTKENVPCFLKPKTLFSIASECILPGSASQRTTLHYELAKLEPQRRVLGDLWMHADGEPVPEWPAT